MGLKTTNYKINNVGIELSEAYALIGRLYMDKSGHAAADFHIQSTRDNAFDLEPLEVKTVTFVPDRNANIYEQAYGAVKREFETWEDDIVAEGEIDGMDNE